MTGLFYSFTRSTRSTPRSARSPATNHRSLTHHEIADDHGEQEKGNAVVSVTVNAVPHGLDPFPAEDPKDDHESVQEIAEVPAWQLSIEFLGHVVRPEQLHAHDGEDEDDDSQYEAQVAQGAHGPADDADEEVEGWPRFGKFEYTELFEGGYIYLSYIFKPRWLIIYLENKDIIFFLSLIVNHNCQDCH